MWVGCKTGTSPTSVVGLVALYVVVLFNVGGILLSHTLPGAVPSARAGLASGFGMGPGVSLSLSTTDKPVRTVGSWLAGVVLDTA